MGVLCGGMAQGMATFSAILVLSVPRLAIKNADSVNSLFVADTQTTTTYHIIR